MLTPREVARERGIYRAQLRRQNQIDDQRRFSMRISLSLLMLVLLDTFFAMLF